MNRSQESAAFAHFEQYIHTHTHLTADELVQIRAAAVFKRVRKRQFLLQEGEVSRHKIFVAKGLLRNYLLKDDGTEHIMRFAPEDTWTLEHESYYMGVPSRYYIEALEDSELLLWTKEDFDTLSARIDTLHALSEKLRTDSFQASQERILMNISYTSEEKYQQFIRLFPDVFRRIPLHMVASYLGVSRETLSRIRHAQMKPAR
jgi:CRP-like cAMP-binding protein